jgi:hypothetical protein
VPVVVVAAPLGHAGHHRRCRLGQARRALCAGRHDPRPQRQCLRRLRPPRLPRQLTAFRIRQHKLGLRPPVFATRALQGVTGRYLNPNACYPFRAPSSVIGTGRYRGVCGSGASGPLGFMFCFSLLPVRSRAVGVNHQEGIIYPICPFSRRSHFAAMVRCYGSSTTYQV